MENKYRPTFSHVIAALCALCLTLTSACVSGEQAPDQPATQVTVSKSQLTLTWPETERDIDVTVYSPDGVQDAPLMIFSTGAFAAPGRYDRILEPIAAAGFTIASPLHVDSEEHPDRDSYGQQDWSVTRNQDMEAVAAHFKNQSPDGFAWIAAGHSFGALIAQEHGGAILPTSNTHLSSHPKPSRIIAISPPGSTPGFIPKSAFKTISVPMLVITGTTDIVPNFVVNWDDHLDSHSHAPTELSTAIIYEAQDHYFNGLYGRETGRAAMTDDDHLVSSIVSFANGEAIEPSRTFPLVHGNDDTRGWLAQIITDTKAAAE